MTKTRDISDLLDANGDVKSTALDNVPASDDASALTTGTLPDARLSSNVTTNSGTQTLTNKTIASSQLTGALPAIDGSALTGISSGGAFESALLHVQDQKSAGTDGGGDVSGYQTRTLNTVVTNEISGSSLSSNQITLPSGTFYIQASAPAYASGNTRLRLRNVSDSSNAVIGLNGEVSGTIAVTPRYFVSGRFTISSSKAFTIEQYVGTSTHSSLGHDTGDGLTEIYTDVHIWKVA